MGDKALSGGEEVKRQPASSHSVGGPECRPEAPASVSVLAGAASPLDQRLKIQKVRRKMRKQMAVNLTMTGEHLGETNSSLC